MNYFDYLNSPLTPSPTSGGPVDPGTQYSQGPSFWQQLMAAGSRGMDAGGGPMGLAAALSPGFSASLGAFKNTPLGHAWVGQQAMGDGTSQPQGGGGLGTALGALKL